MPEQRSENYTPYDCATHVCHLGGQYWLLDEDGVRIPGRPSCKDCARSVVEEYREKLGVEWTMVRLTPEERR
jgi:hypothetical protein